MPKDSQVRVSVTTKEGITKVAALLQLETGERISADKAIQDMMMKAYPKIAEQIGLTSEVSDTIHEGDEK